jgi:hypothetical protein
MKVVADLVQQPIRKFVGRTRSPSERLACVEDLTAFVRKYAPRSLARVEGDYFPVRKVVGRSRAERR